VELQYKRGPVAGSARAGQDRARTPGRGQALNTSLELRTGQRTRLLRTAGGLSQVTAGIYQREPRSGCEDHTSCGARDRVLLYQHRRRYHECGEDQSSTSEQPALRPEIERQQYRGPGVLTREVIVRAVVRIDIPDEPTEKAGVAGACKWDKEHTLGR
jgi:hypothetical protein